MTNVVEENQAAMKMIADESPEAAGLVHALVMGSMNQVNGTWERLYELERQHRQALEVLIEQTLDRLEDAYLGTPREYEKALSSLRYGVYGRLKDLASLHPENHEN